MQKEEKEWRPKHEKQKKQKGSDERKEIKQKKEKRGSEEMITKHIVTAVFVFDGFLFCLIAWIGYAIRQERHPKKKKLNHTQLSERANH